MTSATVTTRYSRGPALEHEWVLLSANDGYTYVCDMSKPLNATVFHNNQICGEVSVSFSGRTATIHAPGATSKAFLLDIMGYK